MLSEAKHPVMFGARRFATLSVTVKSTPSIFVNGLCNSPALRFNKKRVAKPNLGLTTRSHPAAIRYFLPFAPALTRSGNFITSSITPSSTAVSAVM